MPGWPVLVACVLVARCSSADWPMYRADAGRTGYTSQGLPDNLARCWSYRAVHPPQRAWATSERMTFDRAYQPVVAGSTLYFGSSADGKVYALDATTGGPRWSYFTDGPVRFAPAVWRDRVLVAGDDGWLTCLAAADGRLLWRLRGGPRDDMLLGNDRMISRWPARGAPVVADDVVYFAAGIWPSEGFFLYAVDPATGKTLWRNDSCGSIEMNQPHAGARAHSGVVSQGYLAVAGDSLIVPTGRAVPAIFDRDSGRFRVFPLQTYGKQGGADVVAFDDLLSNQGVLFTRQYDQKPQPLGSQVAVHPDHLLATSRDQLTVWDRRRLWTTTDSVDRKGNATTTNTLAAPAWTLSLPHDGESGLIVAGESAVIGGQDRVSLVDLSSRRVVWTGEVEGAACGLAVAQGRLYVSTDRGCIACFSNQGAAELSPQAERESSPPKAAPSDVFSVAAEEIVQRTGMREGYCVDLGCGDGRLTCELAHRTKLCIEAVDPDPAKVVALRQKLDQAGLYGIRVTVRQADLSAVPYPRWFADLIVSGRSVLEGSSVVPDSAVRRFQRPWGGIACLGRPGAMTTSIGGPLEGEGSWTHQYADSANSLCSGDARLQGLLKMLWFRDTDLVMPNRHGRGPAPLVHQGRMFAEGLDALRAVNIYNGRTLWQRQFPGILAPYHQEHLMGVAGTGSNLCLHGDRLYVATGDRCLGLNTANGETLAQWQAPSHPNGKPGTWGYLACEGETILGSLANEQHLVQYRFGRSDMNRLFTESDVLFALDARTGQLKWTYRPEHSLRHNAVAIGSGMVFLIDRPLATVDSLRDPAKPGPASPEPAARDPVSAAHRPGRLLALDVESGQVRWQMEGAFGTLLAFSKQHRVLLMGYQSTRFQLDSELGQRMAAYRAADGTLLWDTGARYLSRPILNDRTIYAQPGAWDLLTGQPLPFALTRSYGCGILAGSGRMIVFRSATLGYVDVTRNEGTQNYGGIRPGCWINAIPAGGLVLLADAASWCTCSYPNQATVALQPCDD